MLLPNCRSKSRAFIIIIIIIFNKSFMITKAEIIWSKIQLKQ